MQAAVSRPACCAYARDEMIVGSKLLSRIVTGKTHVPVWALFVAGVVPALTRVVRSVAAECRSARSSSFASAGIYLGFSDGGARSVLIARTKGWKADRPFTLGPLGMAREHHRSRLAALAAIFRPWYGRATARSMVQQLWDDRNGSGGVSWLGAIYMLAAKPYDRGSSHRPAMLYVLR